MGITSPWDENFLKDIIADYVFAGIDIQSSDSVF
jgi:hypothetical protein